MKLITMTSLDEDEVEVESYDTGTGAYSQLRAMNPVIGVDDLLLAGTVDAGYLIGATTDTPEDLGYAAINVVFAGKLAATPPDYSGVSLMSTPRRFVAARITDHVGVMLATTGVVRVTQSGGQVVHDFTGLGNWPAPAATAFKFTAAMLMANGDIRLVEIDAAAATILVSTPLGGGALNIARSTTLSTPPEGGSSEEGREYGALALAKAMNLAKQLGTPRHIIGSLGIAKDVGFPMTVIFEQYQSVTCPDSSGQYTVCRYGDTGPELARYTANAGYTAFIAGTVDTYPDPTSPTVDTFWFVPTDPTPGAFWQKFKRAEEQV